MTSEIPPLSVPMVFLRVGWMERYQGIVEGDFISRGGTYVSEKGYGHEIFNFSPVKGNVYGYVQPPGGGHNKAGGARLHIERIDKACGGKEAKGVLAIWVATSPRGGAYVVGWYRDARLHADRQPAPDGSNRTYKGESFGYYITARSEDAILLPPDERVFLLPKQRGGGMGQANVWYADDPEIHQQIRREVLKYIETRIPPESNSVGATAGGPQADPLLRQKIEKIAVETVTRYYTQFGYRVDSFEKDNVGWDLLAVRQGLELKLKVKGLSGSDVVVELTPNEYVKMQEHRDEYRVCVVSQALTVPRLEIFQFLKESGRWETSEGRRLEITERVAARCRVE